MSVLGEFLRMSPELLEEIRSVPEDAYFRVCELGDELDVDRAWARLSSLMDRAGFPLNPVGGGALFPDEEHAFGQDGDSRSLTPDQVADVAAMLARTPFEVLGAHLRPLLDSEPWFRIDPSVPMLEPPSPDEIGPYRSEETERAIRRNLARTYGEMTDYFAEAAARRQCMVFWAA